MHILEHTPGGFLSDWQYTYDRPARVWKDEEAGDYVAEDDHDVQHFTGRVVLYKRERLVVKSVSGHRISTEPFQ